MPRKGHRAIPVLGLSILSRIFYSFGRGVLQRLFSTFADGWPGVGLLLLRLLTGAALIHFGIDSVLGGPPTLIIVLQVIGIASGIVLLVGLFTPVAGALAAIVKVWIAISQFSSHSDDPWIALAQVISAAALAMTGPGAWSIDAQRFGRKHIHLRDQ
jgi:putative oxidoreductase